MKLLKCHIENFGVLSGFDFDFTSGLNVICRENGFGKSTFAVFIKAMFYGMPRTGARSVVNNERRRYNPWQGGRYGGFLEFEYQGIRYRVTRYFGRTASKDTFSILDMTNRKSSTPFSEKLGEELFQLDAESFARSTYMPQLSAREMKATTSIRTKLGNLVDNTNDMNNFDTAEASLRKFRSRLRAYRGSEGIIAELEEEYNDLDRRKYEAEKKKPRLQEVSGEIGRMVSERKSETAVMDDLREKIRRSSYQKTLQVKRDQLREMREAAAGQQKYLCEMDARYPAGYPSLDEISAQRDQAAVLQQASRQLQALSLSDQDREAAEKGRAIFGDIEHASKDINACDQWCRELDRIWGGLNAQMLPEELRRLDQLSAQFAEGVPREEELENCRRAADDMAVLQGQMCGLKMTVEEQAELEKLKIFFREGIPDDRTLDDCEQSRQSQKALQRQRESCRLSDGDRKNFQFFQRMFASGVPTEQEIQKRQGDCRRIVELTSKKNTETTRIQKDGNSAGNASGGIFLCGGIGAALLLFGIICFVLSFSVPGILLLTAGFAGLLAAIWLYMRRMVSGGAGRTTVITASAITDDENQELYDLKRSLNDFLLQFYSDAANPENKLVQLLLDAGKYTGLKEKKMKLEAELQKIDEKLEQNIRDLREVFERYYHGEPYRDTFVKELRESCRRYKALNEKLSHITRERDGLLKKTEDCRMQIIRLLHRFYPAEVPEDLRQGVRRLDDDVRAFVELRDKKQAMQSGNAGNQKRAEELSGRIRKTLAGYKAFNPKVPFGQCLQELRNQLEKYRNSSERAARFIRDRKSAAEQKQAAEKSMNEFLRKYRLSGDSPINLVRQADDDVRNHMNAEKELRQTTDRLNQFLADNPEINQQQTASPEELPDPEVLQKAEKETQKKIDGIDSRLRALRQERDSLRRTVENIPDWEDSMARIKTRQQSAEKSCSLIDRTIELLNQAKDNLAGSYVGRIESGFRKYAGSLLEGQLGQVMVDRDLKLYIDERGAAREVGSFSAGTVDSIMLCMRLALVDALFTREKPFLILDDPFVNLDDEHTKRALEILHKISQYYQVVYLVCNSSRR